MKGYRTDENGRWSPVHKLHDDDDVPLVMIGIMAILLFVLLFLQWWFV